MTVLVLERWNWRVSGHARLASLAGAWVLVLMASAPTGLLLPLAAMRTVASPVQLLLNRRLGRSQPLDRRGRLDWLLFALALVASMGVSVAQQSSLGVPTAVLLASVLSPLSIIQLRAAARSYRAYKAAMA
jgi:hypothetical protein